MKIKVADFVFEVNNIYSYAEKASAKYLSDEEADFSFSVAPETIAEKCNLAKERGERCHPGYTEWLEIHRAIAAFLEKRDGILMHGAAICACGGAYIFTAPSGTGKTTHISRWLKLYGENVFVLNGDKPLIRHIDDSFIVYGTPWCGKERLGANTKAPLKGIALLSRADENSIEAVNAGDYLSPIMRQVYFHREGECISNVMDFLDKMLSSVPVYSLKCNISDDAARVAAKLMCGELLEEKSL